MHTKAHLFIALLAASAAARAGDDGLTTRVERALAAPGYQNGRWGVLIVDAESGRVLYERNADQIFRPASVTKLFSTAAALAELGGDYRFVTPVVRRGELHDDGTLRGDLILIAQGDPCLGGRTGPDGSLLFRDVDHSYANPMSRAELVDADPLAGLDHLAREVYAAGVRKIEGDVIIDDRLFDHAPATGSGPRRVSPIVINDNLIDVEVTPGPQPGAPARVRIVPETAFVSFDAQVETVAPGTPKHIVVEPVASRRFVVRGRIAADAAPSYHIYEVQEPADWARAAFIELLRARGVRVSASPLGANRASSLEPRDQVATLPKVAQYTSPPFREYLRVILKVSQNLHASMLPLLLAAKHGETSLADGLRRQGRLLRSLDVDIETISFGGGAGGSPADLVTPRATVALLRAMAARPDFSDYSNALPVLGRDGTLAQAVADDSPVRGHARAKTGTFYITDGLTGKTMLTSKALAGYMETASARKLIFAIFLNDVPLRVEGGDVSAATAEAGRVLGKLCEAVYDDEPAKAESAAGKPPDSNTPKPNASGGGA